MEKIEFLLSEIRTSLLVLLLALLGVITTASLLAFKSGNSPRMVAHCGLGGYSYGDYSANAAGKELFIANCASCHNKNMRDKLTGPALGGVTERWSQYPRQDLYNFIRNSRKMIKSKHPRAVQVWKEYRPARMTKFSSLTDQNIEDLLDYIEHQ